MLYQCLKYMRLLNWTNKLVATVKASGMDRCDLNYIKEKIAHVEKYVKAMEPYTKFNKFNTIMNKSDAVIAIAKREVLPNNQYVGSILLIDIATGYTYRTEYFDMPTLNPIKGFLFSEDDRYVYLWFSHEAHRVLLTQESLPSSPPPIIYTDPPPKKPKALFLIYDLLLHIMPQFEIKDLLYEERKY